jgi:hypothetical protein
MLDLTDLEKQLTQLSTRLKPWMSNLYILDLEAGSHQATEQSLDNPFPELMELLDRLCDQYLQSSAEECAKIRELFVNDRLIGDSLYGYIYRAVDQLQATTNAQWFRRGLAAASIGDGLSDPRDLIVVLRRLYVVAENLGIETEPDRRSDAVISGTVDHYGFGSTQKLLTPTAREPKPRRKSKT